MNNPFQSHAALRTQYENFTGGGTPLATLKFTTLQNQPVVPCTHTKVDDSYILQNGRSPMATVEQCEFSAALLAANFSDIRKDRKCTLTVKSGVTYKMQLWDGGPLEGGETFRFMLVDENFKA